MINITLVCAGGMSTSMLMQKMKESATQKNIDIEIRAMAEAAFEKFEGKTDILLIGPQMGYVYDTFKTKYEPTGMKIAVIDMMDYGMMNGSKVLDDALKL
ncbi:PTS sugar transporter subunit IIB [Streptococcus henryi]|uniref:PTS sugar transporter subunit IIB n=1 Tax=Streptococcus henryi TaxID=439219 RepID=UPI00037732B6|nr:PTS sugar transporter subunit IIB [Streptococcus henryi]